SRGRGLEIRPLKAMINHNSTEVFMDGLEVPAENLIGEEGKGFRYILDGMNAERVLIAAEAIGDARWFIRTASKYASERVVFDRPIGQNQAVQFPIARAYAESEAADLMGRKAAALFDAKRPCGAEANMAKLLASLCPGLRVSAGSRHQMPARRPWRRSTSWQPAIAPWKSFAASKNALLQSVTRASSASRSASTWPARTA